MTEAAFPPEEFEARLARAQAAMAQAELSALMLTAEHDIRWFTGFLTRFWESPTRPWFLVVPAQGAPVAVIPAIGAELMASTWIEDIRTWPAPRPDDDGLTLLADALTEAAGSAGRIGTPMGHESHLRMPLADWFRLAGAVGPARFADAAPLLRTLQMIKSPAEIARIEAICDVGGRAFARAPEIAAIGKPLSRVFAEFQMALLDEGADWVPYLAGGAGPEGYGDVISPASDAPLAAGDVLMLDTGAVRGGYFCDFDRNWAMGSARKGARAAHALLHEATEAGFSAARPGATAADLFAAMNAVIARGGGAGDVGRLGHGLGMRLTEAPSLTATDSTVLAPGMVLTLEPGMRTARGRMMVHEENIVVTETGARWLTERAPAELPVIGGGG